MRDGVDYSVTRISTIAPITNLASTVAPASTPARAPTPARVRPASMALTVKNPSRIVTQSPVSMAAVAV